jgi:hypothetical protein
MLTSDKTGFIQERTATYNRLRGLVSEFGVIAPQSTDALRHAVSDQKLCQYRSGCALMIY